MAREQRKILVGHVTSDKMDKTIVVRVERLKRHALYGKVVRLHKKYKEADNNNHNSNRDKNVLLGVHECGHLLDQYLRSLLSKTAQV